jgi:hypothetical protein
VPLTDGTITSWRASWLPFVHNSSPTSLIVPGKTLGPSSPGNNVSAFVLEGVAWYLTIRCWERGGTSPSPEGAMVVGLFCLVDLHPSSFYFFVFFYLGVCLPLPLFRGIVEIHK